MSRNIKCPYCGKFSFKLNNKKTKFHCTDINCRKYFDSKEHIIKVETTPEMLGFSKIQIKWFAFLSSFIEFTMEQIRKNKDNRELFTASIISEHLYSFRDFVITPPGTKGIDFIIGEINFEETSININVMSEFNENIISAAIEKINKSDIKKTIVLTDYPALYDIEYHQLIATNSLLSIFKKSIDQHWQIIKSELNSLLNKNGFINDILIITTRTIENVNKSRERISNHPSIQIYSVKNNVFTDTKISIENILPSNTKEKIFLIWLETITAEEKEELFKVN